jgi:hypothetical protein
MRKYENTCAMRISHSLNVVGCPIPNTGTFSDVEPERLPDNSRVIVKIGSLHNYLVHIWGGPDKTWNKKANETFDPAKGIIEFVMHFTDANGHFDLWDGSQFTHAMPGGWDNAGTDLKDYRKGATQINLFLKTPTGSSVI